MITWMTTMSLFDSAECLMLPQLATAHRDSLSLFNEMVYGYEDESIGSAPAPLKMMWYGYESALACYNIACSATMVRHGINNGIVSLEVSKAIEELRSGDDPALAIMPPWIKDIDVLSSHRSNLMRRWPERYSWRRIPRSMPYLWPVVDEDGGYELRISKYDKSLLESGRRKISKELKERIANV